MGFKIANTEVINDSGNFVGDFGGLVVNCQLLFPGEALTPQAGSAFGYSQGGYAGPSPTAQANLEKYPFTSDTNATDVGELYGTAGQSGLSSTTHGYVTGGRFGGPSPTTFDSIQKFTFSDETITTDVGELSVCKHSGGGAASTVDGYVYGGSPGSPAGNYTDFIEKFPLTSDTSASCIGNIFIGFSQTTAVSAEQGAYLTGGGIQDVDPWGNAPRSDLIMRTPFSSDTETFDVGELACRYKTGNHAGVQSPTAGYMIGGEVNPAPPADPGNRTNIIQKFPFASCTRATDVATLGTTAAHVTGTSSTTCGYRAGGNRSPGAIDDIFKFSFATDGGSTDVGELSIVTQCATGNLQV